MDGGGGWDDISGAVLTKHEIAAISITLLSSNLPPEPWPLFVQNQDTYIWLYLYLVADLRKTWTLQMPEEPLFSLYVITALYTIKCKSLSTLE